MAYEPDFCDREYNPRLLVPNHEEIKNGWSDKSRSARSRAPHAALDLRYGQGDGETIDVFPAAGSKGACVLLIHGGYWRALDKSDFSFVAEAFARAGITTFVPNYALAPAVTVEHITEQVVQSARWARENAARFRVDGRRLVAVGHSAGGHAAAVLCTRRASNTSAEPLVQAAVGVSGVYDLEPLVHAPFLSADLRLDQARAQALSPTAMRPAPGTRFITAVGERESAEFHRQARLLKGAWGEQVAGHMNVAGLNHFDIVDALADASHPLFVRLLALAKENRS